MSMTCIKVENVNFHYNLQKQEHTITDLSFTARRGEWLAVVGHNGSGKSTLASLLVGLHTPSSGKIYINGMELKEETKWELRNQIGLVFQNPENQFIGTTVKDDVAFALENQNMPYDEMKQRVDRALAMVGMTSYADYDPSRLSGGQKQRVAIAGILALHPAIIVLDEAMVMLDPKSRQDFMSLLDELRKQHQLTIISITHDMNEAAAADRILVLKKGKLMEIGKPAKIFQREERLDVPFTEALRRKLKEQGSTIPDAYMTEDEMVWWLCR
ncbi:energy-coupling factor transporter ATP-binding protein EcfA [Oceanobacillus sojae]|uniref:Energy-coupling factor transporter ATP-binding protein EcfA n=2 Tax=Bacillaceae TaxID=186817 RepID=A0A511ZNN9_9BACI|nr:energy-coupling factor transporter ATP-binding protein EcfA [Oceanobacillus sojae]